MRPFFALFALFVIYSPHSLAYNYMATEQENIIQKNDFFCNDEQLNEYKPSVFGYVGFKKHSPLKCLDLIDRNSYLQKRTVIFKNLLTQIDSQKMKPGAKIQVKKLEDLHSNCDSGRDDDQLAMQIATSETLRQLSHPDELFLCFIRKENKAGIAAVIKNYKAEQFKEHPVSLVARATPYKNSYEEKEEDIIKNVDFLKKSGFSLHNLSAGKNSALHSLFVLSNSKLAGYLLNEKLNVNLINHKAERPIDIAIAGNRSVGYSVFEEIFKRTQPLFVSTPSVQSPTLYNLLDQTRSYNQQIMSAPQIEWQSLDPKNKNIVRAAFKYAESIHRPVQFIEHVLEMTKGSADWLENSFYGYPLGQLNLGSLTDEQANFILNKILDSLPEQLDENRLTESLFSILNSVYPQKSLSLDTIKNFYKHGAKINSGNAQSPLMYLTNPEVFKFIMKNGMDANDMKTHLKTVGLNDYKLDANFERNLLIYVQEGGDISFANKSRYDDKERNFLTHILKNGNSAEKWIYEIIKSAKNENNLRALQTNDYVRYYPGTKNLLDWALSANTATERQVRINRLDRINFASADLIETIRYQGVELQINHGSLNEQERTIFEELVTGKVFSLRNASMIEAALSYHAADSKKTWSPADVQNLFKVLDGPLSKAKRVEDLKLAFDAYMNSKSASKKAVYNVEAVNVLQSLEDGRSQCFSGSVILSLMMLRSNAQLWKDKSAVMIMTSGHILPGYLETASKRLIGLESTVDGIGRIDFGTPKDWNGSFVVISMEEFYFSEIFKRSIIGLNEARKNLIAASDARLGIKNTFNSYSNLRNSIKSWALNSSMFSFGRASVERGDQVKQKLDSLKSGQSQQELITPPQPKAPPAAPAKNSLKPNRGKTQAPAGAIVALDPSISLSDVLRHLLHGNVDFQVSLEKITNHNPRHYRQGETDSINLRPMALFKARNFGPIQPENEKLQGNKDIFLGESENLNIATLDDLKRAADKVYASNIRKSEQFNCDLNLEYDQSVMLLAFDDMRMSQNLSLIVSIEDAETRRIQLSKGNESEIAEDLTEYYVELLKDPKLMKQATFKIKGVCESRFRKGT